MVALVVVSILSSVAFVGYEYALIRARTAEVAVMVDSIKNAEIEFFLKPRITPGGSLYRPCFLFAGLTPEVVTNQKRPWIDSQGGFRRLGVSSANDVYFSYGVTAISDSAVLPGYCLTDAEGSPHYGSMIDGNPLLFPITAANIVALGDLDGDGLPSAVASTLSSHIYAAVGPLPSQGCGGALYDGASTYLAATVGISNPECQDVISSFRVGLLLLDSDTPGATALMVE